jgi:hypothetical protein
MEWRAETAGIKHLELVPELDDREVLSRLEASIAQSAYFKAGVCYWTIAAKRFAVPLAQALSPPGYLCVDLHKPTDIDRLDQLKKAGADVYLHLMQPLDALEPDTNHRVPSGLFHPKMLIFYRQGSVEIWIGSHNWTVRSLSGANMEASVVIRAAIGSAIHHQAEAYLDKAKAQFHQFRSELVPYYKWLQGEAEKATPVLVVSGDSLDDLTGSSIVVIGEKISEFSIFRTVNRNMYLMGLAEGGENRLYGATVRQSGRFSADDTSQAFASMRMVYRAIGAPGHPELGAAQAVVAAAYPKAKYFVVFDVTTTDIDEAWLHRRRREKRWMQDDDSHAYNQGISDAMKARFDLRDRPLFKAANVKAQADFVEERAALVLRSAAELQREQPFLQRLVIRRP